MKYTSLKYRRDLCRLLQEAITTRLAMTYVKKTHLNLGLADALRKAGLVSWYTVGGRQRPAASIIATHTPEELARMRIGIEPSWKAAIWIGLKYVGGREEEQARTTPAMRRIVAHRDTARLGNPLHRDSLLRLLDGQDVEAMPGLRPGELLFVEARDSRVVECREALEEGLETANVICRTSPFKHIKTATTEDAVKELSTSE